MRLRTALLGRPGDVVAALLVAGVAGGAQAGALSGVCPDGSIFIVQRVADVPCREAKLVEPGDIPPLNPEFLPRPYGWEVFNRETDPNNPYNMVEDSRSGGAPSDPRYAAPAPTPSYGAPTLRPEAAAPPPVSAPPPVVSASPTPRAELSIVLAPQELDDLAAIISVLQDGAPATFVRRDDRGTDLELRLARSQAFEARVAEGLAARGTPAAGPVVAFHVQAIRAADFWGNLTFVQGHMAFHPDAQDPAQLGLVEGRFGDLAPGDRVLGYAVLPPHADPSLPIDVYWNDRQLTATLSP